MRPILHACLCSYCCKVRTCIHISSAAWGRFLEVRTFWLFKGCCLKDVRIVLRLGLGLDMFHECLRVGECNMSSKIQKLKHKGVCVCCRGGQVTVILALQRSLVAAVTFVITQQDETKPFPPSPYLRYQSSWVTVVCFAPLWRFNTIYHSLAK